MSAGLRAAIIAVLELPPEHSHISRSCSSLEDSATTVTSSSSSV